MTAQYASTGASGCHGGAAVQDEAGTLSFALPLARWAAWPPADPQEDRAFALGFADAGVRRRLSSLAKASLHVAHQCAGDAPGSSQLRVVYASRHGELTRTTDLLGELATGDELSPLNFSMSVLNASMGVYSIARQNQAACTAISAASGTLGWAMLEASLQLADDPSAPVLLVYADEPVPAVYGEAPGDVAAPMALALLLDSAAGTQLLCETAPVDVGGNSDESNDGAQAEALLRCLRSDAPGSWTGDGRQWSFKPCKR
jgi:hypothetical protein